MNWYKNLFLIVSLAFCSGEENKLFWDGRDWNKILQNSNYNRQITFKIKTAYLHGTLDGRLYSYLKIWAADKELADDSFSETVDYLSNRELIKNIDYFYQDPLNHYIPVANAIIISNMYAERISTKDIEKYIRSTKKWINDLTLDLDTLNYSKLLHKKAVKHHNKKFNQFE